MTRDEYAKWWMDYTNADGELLADLPEPVATLAEHVLALQDRIDNLMSPEAHDLSHGTTCRCKFSQCACAYDHPDAICMVHEQRAVPLGTCPDTASDGAA
jgi:hypothetical protein